MKKKIIKISFLVTFIFVITGCKENSIDMSKYKSTKYGHITCTTNATADKVSKITLKYDVYYNNNNKYIEMLKSVEGIETDDTSILNEYNKAYQSIADTYKDIDYYDISIVKNKTKVTKTTYINYAKVDMDELMKLEGTEDNVKLTNGKIKISDWKDFAKKYGTTCVDSE